MYHDDAQKAAAEAVMQRITQEGWYQGHIVTEVVPVTHFYRYNVWLTVCILVSVPAYLITECYFLTVVSSMHLETGTKNLQSYLLITLKLGFIVC